jgi:hypothetical protein
MNGWIGWVGETSMPAGNNNDITQIKNEHFHEVLEEGIDSLASMHVNVVGSGDLVLADGGYQGIRFPAKLPFQKPRRRCGQPVRKLTDRQVRTIT